MSCTSRSKGIVESVIRVRPREVEEKCTGFDEPMQGNFELRGCSYAACFKT